MVPAKSSLTRLNKLKLGRPTFEWPFSSLLHRGTRIVAENAKGCVSDEEQYFIIVKKFISNSPRFRHQNSYLSACIIVFWKTKPNSGCVICTVVERWQRYWERISRHQQYGEVTIFQKLIRDDIVVERRSASVSFPWEPLTSLRRSTTTMMLMIIIIIRVTVQWHTHAHAHSCCYQFWKSLTIRNE